MLTDHKISALFRQVASNLLMMTYRISNEYKVSTLHFKRSCKKGKNASVLYTNDATCDKPQYSNGRKR